MKTSYFRPGSDDSLGAVVFPLGKRKSFALKFAPPNPMISESNHRFASLHPTHGSLFNLPQGNGKLLAMG